MKNIKMVKLLKMLKQIVSQLEQMCLKLGPRNGYTLTVLSLFHRSDLEQAKARSPKVLKLVLGILRRPWPQECR